MMDEQEMIEERPASLWERVWLFLVTATIIVIDHFSKLLVESRIALNDSWVPFPEQLPFVRITHVSNTGAAFGVFPSGSVIFTVVAIIVSIVIVLYNYRLPAEHKLLRLALGLQLGGAMGNLIDRLRLGHVTDWMDVGPWPVFNVADASIVGGVIVLALLMLFEKRPEPPAAEEGGVVELLPPAAEPMEDRI
jgi:signal peptidase II